LGRLLVDGAKHIRLWGETIRVKATVHTVGVLSAHADQSGLMAWYGHFKNRPPQVLAHGGTDSMQVLAERIQSELNAPVHKAQLGEQNNLLHLGKFMA